MLERKTTPARANFVPSPEFSPPYPPLPHHFNNNHGIQILCQAPKGAIKRALPRPLEQNGDDDLFVLLMGWSPDCEGFNVHEIEINAPIKWKDKASATLRSSNISIAIWDLSPGGKSGDGQRKWRI